MAFMGDSNKKESSSFFEKKEPKKLYSLGFGLGLARVQTSKSFLLLFFKKEVLSFYSV